MVQRVIDGDFIYFVTFNVHQQRWFFVDNKRAEVFGQVIQTCCQMKGFVLFAYCILPNHVHVLLKKQDTEKSERTLGSMRFEKNIEVAPESYLFAHRRLPSRRSVNAPPTLSDLMHSIKSTYSQHLRKGKFWHRRSFVRLVDNQEYFNHLINYIRLNYQKMSLGDHYGQPPFVFINWEEIQDFFQ